MSEVPDHQDNPGLPLPPPVFLAIGLVLAFGLDVVSPVEFLSRDAAWQAVLGFALAIAAIALAGWAAMDFRRAGTHPDPRRPVTALVTSGPFRFVRNPMYCGFLLLQGGVSLVFALEWGLALVPALWLTLHYFVVRREERYMERKFGDPYRDYLRRVRRWGLF